MFFTLALLSMLGYTIQGTLLVKYARTMDGMALAMYRNLSLALSMLPIFFFVDFSQAATLSTAWLELLLGAISGALALSLSLAAQKSLPVGISSAFSGIRILLLFLWGYWFFRETITLIQAFASLIIIGALITLSASKNQMPHLDGRGRRGIFLALLGTFFGSLAFLMVSIAARKTDPLLAGYIWEVAIGVCALLILCGQKFFWNLKFPRIPTRQFWHIALLSSGTLLGTGAFALAVSRGPIGIVNAIGSTSIVVSALLSHFLYAEKLRFRQWFAIGLVMLGLIGLRLGL